jgi:DNA-binding transcriptional regulator YdaS (Cro superfamily)
MNLQQYINSHNQHDRAAIKKRLATELGISESYMRSLVNGNKPMLERWAVPLEKATKGKIRREEIAPHMYVK